MNGMRRHSRLFLAGFLACSLSGAGDALAQVLTKIPGVEDSGGANSESHARLRSTPLTFSDDLQIQVHVVGEVQEPGSYVLRSPARLVAALTACGGVKDSGSRRRVAIKREGKKDQVFDLWKLSALGMVENNPYLYDNDVIVVPLKNRVVKIKGPVRRPGDYELIDEKTLADVVEMAGGFSVGAARFKPVTIFRYTGRETHPEILKVEIDDAKLKETLLVNGDVIEIPHIFTADNPPVLGVDRLPNDQFSPAGYENRVFVTGGVKLPAAYPYNPHYRIPQYFALAGGGTILSKSSVRITTADGQAKTTNYRDSTTLINPGDTINFDEKVVTTEFWIGFMATIASIGLSAVAILTR